MVKPGFYGVEKGEEIQVILPQASEEYGPISHYYLIVVPDDELNNQKNPDQFLTEDVRINNHLFAANYALQHLHLSFDYSC